MLIALSLVFPTTGAECPASNEKCLQEACTQSGGDFSQNSVCTKGAEFDNEEYGRKLQVCEQMDEFCMENDGLVHNMSCCGPVFILLALAAFLHSDGTP